MSLLELMCIGESYNNRRGWHVPVLLGRLHLGLIFCGVNSGGRRSTDKCTLRSFLFIAAVLTTKCGSSAFPNRTRQLEVTGDGARSPVATPAPSTTSHLDCDHQDFPLNYLVLSDKSKSLQLDKRGDILLDGAYYGSDGVAPNEKTLGYFLKGLILPMLISLTLSFGFIVWKNRMKRARLQAIQTALEEARNQSHHLTVSSTSPGLPPYYHPPRRGLVSNALLSLLDVRGQWNLIAEGMEGEGDDYMGEGGETARHRPYSHDMPPDYESLLDPPSYEQATNSFQVSLIGGTDFNAACPPSPLHALLHDSTTNEPCRVIGDNGHPSDDEDKQCLVTP